MARGNQVWLGPNAGYGEAVRSTDGPHNWPMRSFVNETLTPTGTQQRKEGPEPIYDFNDFWELTPEQRTWEVVAGVLGCDAVEPEFPTKMHETIAKKLTAVALEAAIWDKKAGAIPASAEHVETLLCDALGSGHPTAYLDEQLTIALQQ